MEKRAYNEFKGYLASNNIKHKDVAKMLGITHTTFSKKINRSNADFTSDEIRQLCNNFKISSDKFFLI